MQYVHRIRRFTLFYDKRHPANMGAVEVEAFLTYLAVEGHMSGIYRLMARLLYGTGMRLMECVRLRVKDVDFVRAEILAECSEGGLETRMDKRSPGGWAGEWRLY